MTPAQFQVMFPGKSAKTFNQLCKKFENENSEFAAKQAELSKKRRDIKNQKMVTLCQESFACVSICMDKEMATQLSSLQDFGSEDSMGKLNPKILRKLEYMVKQMIGDSYSSIGKFKAQIEAEGRAHSK